MGEGGPMEGVRWERGSIFLWHFPVNFFKRRYMMIWLLALILMAAVAAMGYRQGAVRVGFSLVGILLGILLAALLGRFLRPVLAAVGLKNPILLWLLAPFVVFLLVSIAAKIGGFAVHHKIDVYFKYKAGDQRL